MSKIPRVMQKQFGSQGPVGDFGIFGSKANPPQTFSTDPTAIQSLQAFLNGWGSSIIGNYEPPMEDMNSLFLLVFRQLAYVFQEGISEWEVGTTYYIGSIVKVNGALYNSLVDDNTGNDPSLDSGANWAQGIGGSNGGVPPGSILGWSGDVGAIPSGYLYCNGSAISRVTYSALFAAIGTMYGIGDGTTTFNIPDSRGRVIVGIDGTTDFLIQGQVGGSKGTDLTHNHSMQSDGGADGPVDTANFFNRVKISGSNLYGITGGQTAPGVSTTVTTALSAVNTLPPYIVIGGSMIKI